MKYDLCPFSDGCVTYFVGCCEQCDYYFALKQRDDQISLLESDKKKLTDELNFMKRLVDNL